MCGRVRAVRRTGGGQLSFLILPHFSPIPLLFILIYLFY